MVFSISEYGRLAGISASTIRYYEDENMLPQAERRGGRRVYYPSDLPRLKLLVAARKAGFGIKAIKQIIAEHDTSSLSLKSVVLAAAQIKADSIEQQIRALEKQRQTLIDAQSCICTDLSACSVYI